ncbi:MAG: hypothetical protein V4488_23060, partial [Pseudomonadota bacterium]
HAPDKIGEQYFAAIENFFDTEPASKLHRNLRKMAEIDAGVAPTAADLAATAQYLSANASPRFPGQQLLLDIGFLVPAAGKGGKQAATAGIGDTRQRIAALISTLALSPSDSCRLEPVMMTKSGLRYARSLSCELLGLPPLTLGDELVETKNTDIYVSIAGTNEASALHQDLWKKLAAQGVVRRSLDLGTGAAVDHDEVAQWATSISGSLGLIAQ